MVIHNCLGKRCLESREPARPVGLYSKTCERGRSLGITEVCTAIETFIYCTAFRYWLKNL